MESLFNRIGGEPAVTAAVTLFYEKVLADPTVAPFFDGMSMDAQIQKQIAFMTMALGGPNGYTGRDMRQAHSRLVAMGLNDGHFDAILKHLHDSLVELSVPQPLIQEAATLVEGTREHVLSR